MADTMRIAHLSDLHLLSLEGVRWPEFVNKRWIGGLNLLARRSRHHHTHVFQAMVQDINAQAMDHVVCTGDLTNLGLKAEFRFARTCFDALSLGPAGVTVIPGNHDTYVTEAPRLFGDFFADYCRPDAAWAPAAEPAAKPAARSARAPREPVWPTVRVRGSLAVIGLRSAVPTPWFTAYGRLEAAQLDRLRAVLTARELAGKLRLVLIHHPPAGAVARHRLRGLRGWRALARLLGETGAELVLHGHEHRDLRHDIAGPGGLPIPVLGIQSGSYHGLHHEHTARYRIFDISTRDLAPDGRPRVVAHHLRVWDPERAIFVEDAAGALPPPDGPPTTPV